MDYRQLGATGLRVSTLGFGASPLGNEFGEVDAAECTRAVHGAVDLGINFFDVAPYYGRTLAETRLGIALEGRRHQVVLATKCGRYDVNGFDFSAARIQRSVDESLTRLRTDYLDIWQAHDIEFGDLRQVIDETLPAMREIQRAGKVRFVGVTSFQLNAMRRVAETADIDTVISYCRYNLLITDLDRLLTPTLVERKIGLINASPLHMGVLTDHGPPSWHPAPAAAKQAGSRAAEYCRGKGHDIAALALQFCLAHPYAATTLAGMSHMEHVERNIKAASAAPDPELLNAVRRLLAPANDLVWPCGKPENEDYAEDAPNRRASSSMEIQREGI